MTLFIYRYVYRPNAYITYLFYYCALYNIIQGDCIIYIILYTKTKYDYYIIIKVEIFIEKKITLWNITRVCVMGPPFNAYIYIQSIHNNIIGIYNYYYTAVVCIVGRILYIPTYLKTNITPSGKCGNCTVVTRGIYIYIYIVEIHAEMFL